MTRPVRCSESRWITSAAAAVRNVISTTGSPPSNRFNAENKFSYRALGGDIFAPSAWNAAQFASISAAFAGVIIPGG